MIEENEKDFRHQLRSDASLGRGRFLEIVHPFVSLGYLAVVIAFCMLVMHPAYLAISFVASFSLSIYLCGWKKTGRILLWQIPLVLLIALINPLFASTGETVLFRVGTRDFSLEALVFGLCMGAMLLTMMLWFFNASHLLSKDKIMSLLGGFAPTIGLMLSSIMSLIPRFVVRGKAIDESLTACTAAKASSKNKMGSRIRLSSVLMSWSMEDSIETAASMRSRGWGVQAKRSTYRHYRFRTGDTLIVVFLGALTAGVVSGALPMIAGFSFYPSLSEVPFTWGYIPYFFLTFAPLGLCLLDELRWIRR